ncbi:MAG: hypothetical protein V1816_10025 [Pseudomonadota bacterium]
MSVLPARKNNPINRKAVIDFNLELEEQSTAGRLNESFLLDRIRRLQELGPLEQGDYWLTMARLNELALLCAGNYADAGEFQAAGDLLVNPRRIVVRTPNHEAPVVKERHTPLTRQFAGEVPWGVDVVTWLKEKTTLEIEEPALLPWFLDLLTCSGEFSREYLDSVLVRQKKIASALVFAAACRCPEGMDFLVHRLRAKPAEREFIESNLCLFDRAVLERLGRELLYKSGYSGERGAVVSAPTAPPAAVGKTPAVLAPSAR